MDRTYVSALERTVYSAGIDVVDRLARVLGVGAADLLKPPAPPDGGRRKRPAPATSEAKNRKASGARAQREEWLSCVEAGATLAG